MAGPAEATGRGEEEDPGDGRSLGEEGGDGEESEETSKCLTLDFRCLAMTVLA